MFPRERPNSEFPYLNGYQKILHEGWPYYWPFNILMKKFRESTKNLGGGENEGTAPLVHFSRTTSNPSFLLNPKNSLCKKTLSHFSSCYIYIYIFVNQIYLNIEAVLDDMNE